MRRKIIRAKEIRESQHEYFPPAYTSSFINQRAKEQERHQGEGDEGTKNLSKS